MLKIKKLLACVLVAAAFVSLLGCSRTSNNKNEDYYMVTFLSGMEYWKECYKGFEDAGKEYGIKTVFTGSTQYDINQEVTILEQVIAKKPAGIAVSCINPDALAAPIKKAIDLGIPVVTFDADSPKSGRKSFLATGNEFAGFTAAEALVDQIGPEGGQVAIITLPSQQNHEERVEGFKRALEEKYKNIKLVQIGNGKSDQTEAAKVLSTFLQMHPGLKGVFCTDATSGVGAATAVREAGKVGKVKIVSFDTDRGTLDAIKTGVINASIAQGTYDMGFRSMKFLYEMRNNSGVSIPNFVDTGVSIVTKENVDKFYTK
jgi:ribose transport system substrate-binding protein